MTYVMTDPCTGVKDASCADVRPVECMHASPGAKGYYIDPDNCVDCAVCVAEYPVDAISPKLEVPEEMERFLRLTAAYFSTSREYEPT